VCLVRRYSDVDEMHDAVYNCLINRGEASYRSANHALLSCSCAFSPGARTVLFRRSARTRPSLFVRHWRLCVCVSIFICPCASGSVHLVRRMRLVLRLSGSLQESETLRRPLYHPDLPSAPFLPLFSSSSLPPFSFHFSPRTTTNPPALRSI
jgi:hypothetical protein